MKKQTIRILAIVMAIVFIGLLCIQIFYMRNIVQIRYEQFAQGVRQSPVAVSQHLEQDEARHYLEDDVRQVEMSKLMNQYIGEDANRAVSNTHSQHAPGSKPTSLSKALRAK